jgi:hypothetical protein
MKNERMFRKRSVFKVSKAGIKKKERGTSLPTAQQIVYSKGGGDRE